MNKNKAIKIINQLEENFKNGETQNNRLYVETWCIGTLHMMKAKMDGVNPWFTGKYTYKQLHRDLVHYVCCESISDHIKEETMERIFTEENATLVNELGRIIYAR